MSATGGVRGSLAQRFALLRVLAAGCVPAMAVAAPLLLWPGHCRAVSLSGDPGFEARELALFAIHSWT